MVNKFELVVLKKEDFQKLLNLWKHLYNFDILWMNFEEPQTYHALIYREDKHRKPQVSLESINKGIKEYYGDDKNSIQK